MRRHFASIIWLLTGTAACLLVWYATSSKPEPSVEMLPVVKLPRAEPPDGWNVSLAIVNDTGRPFAVAINKGGAIRNIELGLDRDGQPVPPQIEAMRPGVKPDEIRIVKPGETLTAIACLSSYYEELEPGVYTLQWGLYSLPPDLTKEPSVLEVRRRLVLVIE